MRKIKIKDQQLKDLVDKKYEILLEGKANAKKADKLRQRNTELEKQLEPVKNKILELMKKAEKDISLDEFEVILTTQKNEQKDKKEYNLVIEDHLEAFKENFKKQKEYENIKQRSDKKHSKK